MDPGDHDEGEKHHLRNFIAMRVKFFSRILSSTLWQKLSRKLISWSQLMIQSKWWEVGRIIPYDFVMYDLDFCHFKTYEILHSALRHPVLTRLNVWYLEKLFDTISTFLSAGHWMPSDNNIINLWNACIFAYINSFQVSTHCDDGRHLIKWNVTKLNFKFRI